MKTQISFTAWPLTRVVKLILIVNAVIWLITILLSKIANSNFLFVNLALTPYSVFYDFHIWKLFTYMWLHDIQGFNHILFNSLFLWMFGGTLEQKLGTKRFIQLYLICGIGAGVVVLVTGLILNPSIIVVGASGALYGLVAVWAIANPQKLIYLFGVFPVKAKYFALFPIGYAFLDFLVEGSTVSHSAHLGGLAIGALYITGYWHPGMIKDKILYLFFKHKLKGIKQKEKKNSQQREKRKPPPGGGYWN
ncbi:MAG: rhomboid family intramembrane serine protease [Desulfobacteraceae bacterium]|nr:rhomboid family intramembrane serine protease [Desulfobacteraceae bacterium]